MRDILDKGYTNDILHSNTCMHRQQVQAPLLYNQISLQGINIYGDFIAADIWQQ